MEHSEISSLTWQWAAFHELTVEELYAILMLRQRVFVVEQRCPYLDIDGKDEGCFHLCGWKGSPDSSRELLAYLRVLPPGVSFPELSLGRIVTAPEVRGTGLGRQLMHKGLAMAEQAFGPQPIRISAQMHLKKFYETFGFRQVSEPYDEDGILHIEMLRE